MFVESVKPGGAAQVAGLVAGDMILKVNIWVFNHASLPDNTLDLNFFFTERLMAQKSVLKNTQPSLAWSKVGLFTLTFIQSYVYACYAFQLKK